MSTEEKRSGVAVWLRFRAAMHETRCLECRVTWTSWVRRLIGDVRGYAPLGFCSCAEPLRRGASVEPCPLHGLAGDPS